MVREPPRINSEQGMYGKLPTLYEDLDDGQDPIALGVTLKPTHKQWVFDGVEMKFRTHPEQRLE